MQLEYKSAEYLSVGKCASNRRLISRFRTGCHGLRVDTGCWADDVHLDRTDRLCLVCKSLDCVEDEQHFVFGCPALAYSHIRSQHLDLLQHCCTIGDFMTSCEPNVVISLGNALHVGSEFTELYFLSVAPQDVKYIDRALQISASLGTCI